MATIDVEGLLAQLDADAPCGEDLRYDPIYAELRNIIQGKPDVEFGETKVEATEPEWPVVRKNCLALFTRTKDLRVSVYLTLALLKLEGLAGFRDGLSLTRGLVERYWEHVHPQLDPEDPDPVERVNILAGLSVGGYKDPLRFDARLRKTPFCSSPTWGRYSLRDVAAASGDPNAPVAPGKSRPEMSAIAQAVDETDVESLRAQAQAVEQAAEHVRSIDAALGERVGSGKGADMTRILDTLSAVAAQITPSLAKRDAQSAAPAAAEANVRAGGGGRNGEAVRPGPAGAAGVGGSMDLSSKADVQAALERIRGYYERYEPSSPIPLLLTAAQRLVPMNFVEIMKHLTPEVYQNLISLSGLGEKGEGGAAK